METLLNDFLNKAKIDFDKEITEEGEHIFSFGLDLEMGVYTIWLVVGHSDQILTSIMRGPVRIMTENRDRTDRLLRQVNQIDGLRGEFRLKGDSGDIFYTKSFTMEESMKLEELLGGATHDMEYFLPGIIGAAYCHHRTIQETFEVGEWVIFNEDQFIEPDHIIVEGMLGVVVDHPHAHYICTPGISTMIQLAGTEKQYGYLNSSFKALGRIPPGDELDKSIELKDSAFSILEEKYGYTGYVRIGKKIYPQEKLCKELIHNSKKIREWLNEEGRDKDIAGVMKRIKKVLKAFKNHPDGTEALELATAVENAAIHSQEVPQLMQSVSDWAERANDEERLETQTERINEVKRSEHED